MRQRAVVLLVLAVALSQAPAASVAQGAKDARGVHIDASGRVWSYNGEWSLVDGIPRALSGSTLQGEAMIVSEDGSLLRSSGKALRRVDGIEGARAVSCGPAHCLVLDAWGDVFELRPGESHIRPVQGVTDAVAIAAAAGYALAGLEDGSVVEWEVGQDGSDSPTPRRVKGIGRVVDVAGNDVSAFALLETGEVMTWNAPGALKALGEGSQEAPSAIAGLRARSIAAIGERAWASTPLGEVVELTGASLADILPSANALRVQVMGERVIAIEADGSVEFVDGSGERTGGTRFATESGERQLAAPQIEAVPGAASAVVIANGDGTAGADAILGQRLQALGFGVAYVNEAELDPATLHAASVVVISPSVRSKQIDPAIGRIRVPVVALDPFAATRLGLLPMTATSWTYSGSEEAVVIRGDHPLGGGGDGAYKTSRVPGWIASAQPSNGEIAAIAQTGLGTVFSFEKRTPASGGVTPARRSVLFLGPDPSEFQDAGWALFDEAIRWSVGAKAKGELQPGRGRLGGGGGPVPYLLTGGSGTILLVAGAISPLSTSDAVVKSRMEAMGFTVQTKLASSAVAGDASGKVLVYVCGSSPNADILAKFLNVTVPVLIQSPGIVDDMLMSAYADRGTDSASTLLPIANASHPIAYPLSGSVTYTSSGVGQSWGIGSGGVQRVASTAANSGHYALFVYPSGASMVGMNAPSRRVFFGVDGLQNFTSNGLDIFDRMIFWATATNRAPLVDAGPDQSAYEGVQITLNGVVTDDGLPSSPGSTTKTWSVNSAPTNGSVSFGTPSAAVTTATFTGTGVFVLRLRGYDGALTVDDYVTVTVYLPDTDAPPVVNAGADKTAQTGVAISLSGSATDDGLPPGSTLSYLWTKTSGPGTVTFGTATATSTTATFSAAGTYVVRLTATEKIGGTSYLSGFDELIVTVSSPVLLVVGNTTLSASDASLKSRIEALGFQVVVQLGSATVTNDANGKVFVWCSGSTPNVDVADKFLNKGFPIVIQTAGSVDDMEMTPGDSNSRGSTGSQTQAAVTAPASWLAAGLSGTITTTLTPASYDWGIPASAAVKVAAIPSATTHSTVFAYEAGATLSSGNPAAGRRLFFGYGNFDQLSADAAKLFKQAVYWLASKNGSPIANAGADQVISWSSPSVVANLSGAAVDDGLPGGSSLVTAWAAQSGPAAVVFGNASSLSTTATFSEPGDYLIQLQATESLAPSLSHTDVLWVSVVDTGSNVAPVVSAGPDKTVRLPAALPLTAIASDDGLPLSPGALSVSWSKVSGPGTASFSPSNALSTVVTFSAAGVYALRVTASDGAASSYDDVTVVVEAGKQALLVVGSTSLSADDAAAKAVLEASGFVVTATSSANAGDATGKNLVVISESVNSATVAGTFTSVAVPILTWEQQIFDDMGMTPSPEGTYAGTTTGTQIAITAAAHPLAGSLTGNATVYTSTTNIGWGIPGANAIKVATVVGDSNKATIFAYEAGSAMAAGTATARRVGLFVRPAALNADGLGLLRAAIQWATERPAPALLVTAGSSPTGAEAALRERIAALGFAVSTLQASSATGSSANGKAVVVVAPGASTGTTFVSSTVPVVVMNQAILNGMGMTGATSGTHFGTVASQTQVSVTDSQHPLGAHLSGTVAFTSSADTLGWGAPPATATAVATVVGAASQKVSFGYEVGAAMFAGAAPDRRVAVFLGAASGTTLTTQGKALFDAAVLWAAASDADADGLSTFDEYRNGTDPHDSDSNDDGVLDGVAVSSGISASSTDTDGDGLTNVQEAARGTNPFLADTDGDGVIDSVDCFPLDATRNGACPASNPGDTTPPGVTLVKPASATLISSVP